MGVPRLVPYIKKQMSAQYDANTIRGFLVRRGYDSREIDEAFDYMYKKPKKSNLPLLGIVGLLLISVIIVIGVLFLFRGNEDIVNPEIEEPIQIPIELETPDVVETEESGEEVEVIELKCESDCNDNNECTIDYCGAETAFSCVNEIVKPCCGNGQCESGESNKNCKSDCKEVQVFVLPASEYVSISDVILEVKEIAKSSIGRADNYCKGQELQNYKDSCYNVVAEIAQESRYCDNIVSELKANSCYATAATKWQDFTVCEKITDKYLRSACNNYASVAN